MKKYLISKISKSQYLFIKKLLNMRFRIIFDFNLKKGNYVSSKSSESYNSNIDRYHDIRQYLFENLKITKRKLDFLEIGSGAGDMKYLLQQIDSGISHEGFAEENLKLFNTKFHYYGLDINFSDKSKNIFLGDICDDSFQKKYIAKYPVPDIVYSNNVFEHLKNPWKAAKNIVDVSKEGTSIIITAPFSLRYHKSPNDYFRFTHEGLIALFSEFCDLEILINGYDTNMRRVNWQGDDDGSYVKEDTFGAWRENWFSVLVAKIKNKKL